MNPAITTAKAMTLLGVKTGATQRQVRKAWRRLARRIHPDQGGTDALFRQGRAAYDLLITGPFPLTAPTRRRNGNRPGRRAEPEPENAAGWEPAAPVSPLTDRLRQAVKDGPTGAAPPPVTLEDALGRLPEGAGLAVRHRWSATGDPWDTDYAVWAAHFPPARPDGWCVGLEGLDAPGLPEPVVGGYEGRLEVCPSCDAVLVGNLRAPARTVTEPLADNEEGVIYTLV